MREARSAAQQAAGPPPDAITPEHTSDVTENDWRLAFAELARARKQSAQKPDLDLAEGLLTLLKDEAAPSERFSLINAYLDAVAGIEDPKQAQAAIARLAEAGAAADAVYN